MDCQYCTRTKIPMDQMASKRKCQTCFVQYQREYQRDYQRKRYWSKHKAPITIRVADLNVVLDKYFDIEIKEKVLRELTC